MKIEGWKYYNHAAIPTTAPHENPDLTPIEDKSIWKIDGKPILARWTTDFDCAYETNWWYIIKDNLFDISQLKAKRRYEINKGIRNFNILQIDPVKYSEELYEVQVAAFSAYPSKYRPTVDKKSFVESVHRWENYVVIGAFHIESDELCGYALLSLQSYRLVGLDVLKSNPDYEKEAVNAALVYGVLRHLDSFLLNGGYICDGARSINHETAFQDYLEKYFGFRKAYCKLNITYNPKLKWIINLLYPIRKFLAKLDWIGKIHQLNSVFKMEEIVRKQKKLFERNKAGNSK